MKAKNKDRLESGFIGSLAVIIFLMLGVLFLDAMYELKYGIGLITEIMRSR